MADNKISGLRGRCTRFRVFNVVKSWMLEFNECPTAVEVADVLGDISARGVLPHMVGLQDATGLPRPIIPDKGRYGYESPNNQGNICVDEMMKRNIND